MTQSPEANGKYEATHVELDLIMDVPIHQPIKYSPNFLEKSNTLWYQFLALFIPSYFIIFKIILGGAFRRKIL